MSSKSTSSNLALVPILRCSNYCASKAALHHWILCLREQLKETNIRVIEVFPPIVESNSPFSCHEDIRWRLNFESQLNYMIQSINPIWRKQSRGVLEYLWAVHQGSKFLLVSHMHLRGWSGCIGYGKALYRQRSNSSWSVKHRIQYLGAAAAAGLFPCCWDDEEKWCILDSSAYNSCRNIHAPSYQWLTYIIYSSHWTAACSPDLWAASVHYYYLHCSNMMIRGLFQSHKNQYEIYI